MGAKQASKQSIGDGGTERVSMAKEAQSKGRKEEQAKGEEKKEADFETSRFSFHPFSFFFVRWEIRDGI